MVTSGILSQVFHIWKLMNSIQDIQSMVVLIPYTMEKPVFGNSLANTVCKENVFVFLLEHCVNCE